MAIVKWPHMWYVVNIEYNFQQVVCWRTLAKCKWNVNFDTCCSNLLKLWLLQQTSVRTTDKTEQTYFT